MSLSIDPRFRKESDGGSGFCGEAAVQLREGARALAFVLRCNMVARGNREVAQACEHLARKIHI
jgi:hypothetical protein